MSQEDRERWDRQHVETTGTEQPAAFLREIIEGGIWDLPRGRALDVACGKGRNALYLAAQGFDVTAVDVSPVALAAGRRRAEERSLAITWQQADLDNFEFDERSFDLVINFNFLQRSLMPRLLAAVKRGGFFIFETFLIDQQAVGHPHNPDYLLRHNELLHYCRELRVLFYREGKFRDGNEPSFRAGILAQQLD